MPFDNTPEPEVHECIGHCVFGFGVEEVEGSLRMAIFDGSRLHENRE